MMISYMPSSSYCFFSRSSGGEIFAKSARISFTSARARSAKTLRSTVAAAKSSTGIMKVVHAGELSKDQLQNVTARPRVDFTSILDVVCCSY